MVIEICAANIASALAAQAGGANRIELCDNLWEGGTTPSAGMLKILRKQLQIEVFVLIRPRGGDFLYSAEEFETMLEDIAIAKDLGANGIVSGVLKADGSIDCDRRIQLIEAAAPLPFTFHRAFDCCRDLSEALEDLILCGATRILRSGGANSVSEGLNTLKLLYMQAAGRISILPGGGINTNNAKNIVSEIVCGEIHLSAKKVVKSTMQFTKEGLFMNGSRDIKEDELWVSNVDLIKNIRQQLGQK